MVGTWQPMIVVVDDLVPEEVTEDALNASMHAKLIEREGAGPGSLTNDGLRYYVCTGPEVFAFCRTLYRWAEKTLPPIVSAAAQTALDLSPDPKSKINVNVLRGTATEYELHTDSCPYTALIFCTEHDEGQGVLVARPKHGVEITVAPKIGRMVIFEGARIPHAVTPVEGRIRVSVPIAFYPAGTTYEDLDRGSLDSHLYASADPTV